MGEIQKSREDVDRADLGGNPFPLELGKRRNDEKRHVDHGVVNEEPMGLFAMASQSFAVVTDEDEDRFLIQTVLRQPGHAPADLFIHKSDLAVIEAGAARESHTR